MSESIESRVARAALRRHAWAAGLLLALGLQCPMGSHAAGCTLTTVELPVHMVGQRAIATVGINGQDVPMLVDSGAWYSMMSNASAEQLHLSPRYVPGFQVEGITGGADAHVASARLTLIKGEVPNAQFIIGGNDLGSGAMGLLGRNILSHTDTEYDLAHGVIRFVYPGDGCAKANMAYWAGNAPVSVIDLDNTDPRPVAAIESTARLNGTSIDVMFDTGATTLVSLAAARRAGVRESELKPAGRLGGIGRGSADSWTAPFARFEIGAEAISNNTLWVGDFDLRHVDMLLGMDFFLSHRIYVSRKQSKMYFTYAGGPVFARNVDASASAGVSGAASTSVADEGLDADALIRLGEALRARGDLAHALADLDRACMLAPNNATCFDARALVRLARSELEPAASDYDIALRLDPGLVHARLGRAHVRALRKDRAGALADLDLLDEQLPKQQQSRWQLAGAYVELGEPARAIAQYDLWIAAHAHDAGLASAYQGRGQASRARNDLPSALADLDRAIALEPDNAAFHDARAGVRYAMEDWDKAVADYDTALRLDPGLVHARLGRAYIREFKKDRTGALADLDVADRQMLPSHPSRLQMANAYGELGESARAIAQFDLWIAAHPKDGSLPTAYNGRCWRRVVTGHDLDKAMADCDQAIALDPANWLPVDSRAWVWLREGQWQKAREDFDHSLAMKAERVSSLYGRGIAKLRLGDKAGGDADLAAARKLRPGVDAEHQRNGLSAEQLAAP